MSDKPFRVLAIEGGGMRGYYTATFLNALCRHFKGDPLNWGKNLDLICGTSTGAILACAIAKGIPLQEVMGIYKKEGKRIFPRSFSLLGNFCRHSADADHLKSVLQKIFGDLTLEDVYNKQGIALCIPTVNVSDYLAKIFKTPHKEEYSNDKKYHLVDVCMASAAAPLLFPPHEVSNPDNPDNIKFFVDGGVWANTPVLIALIEALRVARKQQDIHVLSVGTVPPPGGNLKALKKKKSQWGIKQWGMDIMEMPISAQSYGYNSMARFVAEMFSENGRTVKVIWPAEKIKSCDGYSAIGIDKAKDIAIQTMSEMAEADALNNLSKAFSNEQISEIKDFFISQNTSEEVNHGETKKHQ